jgi:hypothetical protein
MGTWGTGIQSDDLVADIISDFDGILKKGGTIETATSHVHLHYADSIGDSDEEPLFWLALAFAQWRYNAIEQNVLEQVRNDITEGKGLDRWEDSPADLRKRQAVLQKFLAKIELPNAHPKPFPKQINRKAKFQIGDCLSLALENNKFGAAIVIAVDEDDPEYPLNLIARLSYESDSPPSSEIFALRQWQPAPQLPFKGINIGWYLRPGFRKYAPRLQVVGKIEILESDPKSSSVYCQWCHLVESNL